VSIKIWQPCRGNAEIFLKSTIEKNRLFVEGRFFKARANPTIASYIAGVVNFYNAKGSIARFENKNISYHFEKRSSLLQRWRCSCKFESRRIGSSFANQVVVGNIEEVHNNFLSIAKQNSYFRRKSFSK
jgi:hypothetical protein